jgi:hypothetical protein
MLHLAAMKKGQFSSFTSIMLIILSGIVITLSATTGYLYRQNKHFQSEQRELIIQNDSIISVNIKLTQALETKSGPAKNPSLSFKSQDKK